MYIIWQVVYLTLYVFWVILLARLILEWVLNFSRRWQPKGGSAATLEVVWSVTDPPIRALRRVIPPLRVGTVSVDLAFLVLLAIVFVLLQYVVYPLSH